MWNPSTDGGPDHWQAILFLVLAPISWIPEVQRSILRFLLEPPGWAVVAKTVFLLLPALLFLWALWCTAVSVYTLVFRANRRRFCAAMLMAWWDAARAVCGYWVGLARLAYLAMGWLLILARLSSRLLVETVRQLFLLPAATFTRLAGRYFRPGLPWIAVVLLLAWAALEASLFTYVLFPSVREVLETVVGVSAPDATGPVLYGLVVLILLGDFTCIDALRESIERRHRWVIAQRAAVLLVVSAFEIGFLYRQLVEAVAPRLAGRTGLALTLPAVLALAAFVWLAVRGAGWFLFGSSGARSLAAVVARRAPEGQEAGSTFVRDGLDDARVKTFAMDDIRHDIAWIHAKARDEVELLALPVVQLLAAGLNLAVVVLTSRPVFTVPLQGLKDVSAGREILARLQGETGQEVSGPAAARDIEPDTAPAGAVGGGYWSGSR